MATRKNMPVPTHGFSLRHLDATARHIDWSASFDPDQCMDRAFEPVLPPPTYGDWEERCSPGDMPDEIAALARKFPGRVMTDDHCEEFTGTRAYDEWRDSFEPMMSYGWPVSLAYGVSVDDAVTLMAQFAPACSLVSLSGDANDSLFGHGSDAPEYVIALTGGGMDLSDNIAAAYMACGCIPPETLLARLHNSMSPGQAALLPLKRIYREAAAFYRVRAANLRLEALLVTKA